MQSLGLQPSRQTYNAFTMAVLNARGFHDAIEVVRYASPLLSSSFTVSFSLGIREWLKIRTQPPLHQFQLSTFFVWFYIK